MLNVEGRYGLVRCSVRSVLIRWTAPLSSNEETRLCATACGWMGFRWEKCIHNRKQCERTWRQHCLELWLLSLDGERFQLQAVAHLFARLRYHDHVRTKWARLQGPFRARFACWGQANSTALIERLQTTDVTLTTDSLC